MTKRMIGGPLKRTRSGLEGTMLGHQVVARWIGEAENAGSRTRLYRVYVDGPILPAQVWMTTAESETNEILIGWQRTRRDAIRELRVQLIDRMQARAA